VKPICRELGIGKSSIYRKTKPVLAKENELALLTKHFHKHKGKVGIRQLKMILERSEDLIMNHKKIARLKKKHGLITQIRRKNKYRQFAKKKIEHATCANLLDRNFKGLNADQVYVTDITTLNHHGKKAYVAVVKDLGTKEVVSKSVSNRIDIALTNSAIQKALNKLEPEQKERLMVHSDQGFHFTHFSYRNLLAECGVTQSMSRKGNCLDNAPVESFFGLMKDHLDLDGCETIQDVEKEVTRVINYYNKDRPQVGLNKMPPTEYRRHLLDPAFY
jgi:transposase InsO family protein